MNEIMINIAEAKKRFSELIGQVAFGKKRPNPHLLERLSSHPPEALFTSVICVMELRMGSALRDDFEDFWKKIPD